MVCVVGNGPVRQSSEASGSQTWARCGTSVTRSRSSLAPDAGAKHKLVFIDRLLATLSHGATHDALACRFGVDRSTITRAIDEVRPLLAMRGCNVTTGIRLRTLTDVIEHLGRAGRPRSSIAPRSGCVGRHAVRTQGQQAMRRSRTVRRLRS
ncbi:helix-turn-helix domain-containing protein [Streptomyces aureus]|uniref:helix-turn-helix domain-containing protein n=1 Tax=Streptomyces aureus TaxID=193461 RepID=UPI0031D2A328